MMKNYILLFALFVSSLAFAQDFSGKYKLKYVSYGKDTVESNDTNVTKLFAYKVAKGQNPKMEQKDSAAHVGAIKFSIDLFNAFTLNFKSNGEYWLIGFVSDPEGTKNGTFKLKNKTLTVTTNSGKEEVYTTGSRNGIENIIRTKNGLSFIFEKQ